MDEEETVLIFQALINYWPMAKSLTCSLTRPCTSTKNEQNSKYKATDESDLEDESEHFNFKNLEIEAESDS